MTLRQHKRRYCGKFYPGFRRWGAFNDIVPTLHWRRLPYDRCNPRTYGG
jgi:hypothetical protein